MISCRDVKHLFGRYLDGELNPSLQTELHAHRLQCNECQNELALLEACGDVIALDRREPTVSASFTDRVLLAHRAQVRPVRRNWGRSLLIFGSPLAAAASIALMISVIRPMPRTIVAGEKVAIPAEFRKQMATRQLSPEAQAQLDDTPAMSSAGFIEQLLVPFVERSKNTASNARQGAESVLEALREGLSSTNETLIAQWRSAHSDATTDQVGPPAPMGEQGVPDANSDKSNSPTGDPVRNPY